MQATQTNFSKCTNDQLRDFIQSTGLKVPSGYRKKELIMMCQGIIEMYSRQISPTNPNRDKELTYVSVEFDHSQEWFPHLLEKGWAVACIPNFDPAEIRDMFLQWLENTCDRFKADDPSTWVKGNIPINYYGVFRHFLGNTEFIWRTREACLPIFSQIWNTEDLLVSLDGGCFLVADPSAKPRNKHWMHCDQGRELTHFACVQGIVNLFENGPDDGGTLLIENTNHKFEEYIHNHPIDGITAFFPIDPFDPLIREERIIKPCLRPGEILLFDSRMFHCNTAPKSSNPRMCIYVSMMPKAYAKPEDIAKRLKAYEKGCLTGHWCYGPYLSVEGMHPNPLISKDLPKPEEIERANMTSLRCRLLS